MLHPPKIFVSYSHKDRAWLERLQVHFKALERDGSVDLWDDTEIKYGADWDAEIAGSLAEAKASILLVSADFLASDYIANEELNTILKAGEDKGLLNLMVILSPCVLGKLAKFQSVNDPEEPLEGMTKVEQEMVFVRLVETIKKVLPAQPNRTLSDSTRKQQPEESPIPQFRLVVGHQDAPDQPPEVYRFHQEKVTLGRDSANDLVLSDQNQRVISKMHAEITCEAGKLFLTDLDSLNYTHLNGRPLHPYQNYELLPGNIIQIGPFKIGLERLAAMPDEDRTVIDSVNPYTDDAVELATVLRRIAKHYSKEPSRRDQVMLKNALSSAMMEGEWNEVHKLIGRWLLSKNTDASASPSQTQNF